MWALSSTEPRSLISTGSTSVRPLSMSARRTRRPMRPNPLIAIFAAIFVFSPLRGCIYLSAGDSGNSPADRRLGYAEMLVQHLRRGRGTEAGHADEHAVGAEPAVPAEAAGGFHADAQRGAQHL